MRRLPVPLPRGILARQSKWTALVVLPLIALAPPGGALSVIGAASADGGGKGGGDNSGKGNGGPVTAGTRAVTGAVGPAGVAHAGGAGPGPSLVPPSVAAIAHSGSSGPGPSGPGPGRDDRGKNALNPRNDDPPSVLQPRNVAPPRDDIVVDANGAGACAGASGGGAGRSIAIDAAARCAFTESAAAIRLAPTLAATTSVNIVSGFIAADGSSCRRVEQIVTIEGRDLRALATVCQHGGGHWRLAP